ncbi:MAG: hypothetical protein ACJAR2_000212 [Ilumatobacter sp.]|jgi:hypothetical protein
MSDVTVPPTAFTEVQGDLSWFPQYGAPDRLAFLVIIVAMVVLGKRAPDSGSVETWKLPAVPAARVTPMSWRYQWDSRSSASSRAGRCGVMRS